MQGALAAEYFIRFAVSLWAIWGGRRKAIYEGIFKPPQAIHGFINSYKSEPQVLAPIKEETKGAASHPMGWIAPPESFAKLNVDAAVGRAGRHGVVGAIFRERDESFLGASRLFSRTLVIQPHLKLWLSEKALI